MPSTTNSDSDSDDSDYVPPEDDYEYEVVERFELGGTVAGFKRRVTPLRDSAEDKKQRDTLWASFQASVVTPSPNGNEEGSWNGDGQTSARPSEAKRVKIEKTYLFAGKYVTEIVEVPEDSEDAKKWPRLHTSDAPGPSLESHKGEEDGKAKDEVKDEDEGKGSTSTPIPSPTPPTAGTSAGVKRPGPRKPRTALPSIPKASQAKKITTLDKSAMDWRAHVASQSANVKDELDANRRGGGYLEKVEFLKRVEDRRDDAFEASKASKRRKTGG